MTSIVCPTSPEHSNPNDFYESKSCNIAEAARLQEMAQVGDRVSLELTDACATELGIRPQDSPTILDIGCGNSPTLGEALTSRNFTYICSDRNAEAVTAQLNAGFTAIHTPVGSPATGSNTADIVHGRYVMGWLNGARGLFIQDALFVGKNKFGMVCIDYDWSVIKGPDEFIKVANLLTGVLATQGYNKNYGGEAYKEVQGLLNGMMFKDGGAAPYVLSEEYRKSVYEGPISTAQKFFEMHIAPVVFHLRKNGIDEKAEAIEAAYGELREFCDKNPQEKVKLPDIVGFYVGFKDKEKAIDLKAKQMIEVGRAIVSNEVLLPGVDYESIFSPNTSISNVVLAKSEKLIHAAQITQGLAYRGKNRVEDDALNEDGTLKEHIVPTSLIERTQYITVLGDKVMVNATIGMIGQDQKGITSLPIVEKMLKSDDPEIQLFLRSHPAVFDSRTTEATGYGTHPSSTDSLAGGRALLGFSKVSLMENRQYAVMGIVQDTAEFLIKMYGSKAFQRIGKDTFCVGSENVNDSVRLVPFVVDAFEFPQNAKQYIAALQAERILAGKRPVGLFSQLIQDCNAVVAR